MKTTSYDPLAPQEMLESELAILGDVVRSSGASDVLEVGMANGSSSIAILTALRDLGRGHLTSIDPYQLAPVQVADGMVRGFGGTGVENLRTRGLAHLHTLIPDADYLALPQLVQSGQRFDFVLIDGYHSFDYVMLDAFYSDLLLRPGGTLAFHDSSSPAVFQVCQFVAHNKAYRSVGPPLALMTQPLILRAARRLRYAITGRAAEFRERRLRWKSLAVFVKEADRLADQFTLSGI